MHVDFFDFFRYLLGTVVTIYALVVTLQWAYGWYISLAVQGRFYTLARRYLMLHGLRLRVKTFGGDVLICILLLIVWVLIVEAHHIVSQIHRVMR
jgi:hypothetical protein